MGGTQAEDNKRIVGELYESVANGKRDEALAAFDPGIVLRESEALPYGGVHTGLDSVLTIMAEAGAVFDTSGIVVDEILADGDRVVALVRIPFRDTDPPVYMPVADSCVLRDGKIVEMTPFYFDTVAVRDRLP